MFKYLKYYTVFLLFVQTTALYAQSINKIPNDASAVYQLESKPIGYFIEDKAQIGLKIHYSLSLTHPSDMQVIFPDSSYTYSTFEYENKQFFTTKTSDNVSVDSVVYEFTTFEVDPIQTLTIPVFIVIEKDCTTVYPAKDSILLEELIKSSRLDTLKYKENVASQNLETYFNYPYLILGILVFALFVFIVWILLGKRIIKSINLYQFRLRHSKFLRDYTRLTTRIKIKQSPMDIEKALTIWKKHLEYIEDEPFSTYTSKEISQKIPDQNLILSLKGIDRAIYGKELSEEIESSMVMLKDYSIVFFEKKQKEMQNA